MSYILDIAEYRILFQSKEQAFRLVPSSPQVSFISPGKQYDIAVNVSRGPVKIPAGTEVVFEAPYVEEVNGVPVTKKDKFWKVIKHGDYILVYTTMPLSETINEAMMVIRPGEKSWDIIIDTEDKEINPIAYPLDGLLFYYITALNGDIFIHGSGVECDRKGFLFTGPSGTGKTTIAKLFDDAGAYVIHDDRLIIRKINGRFVMFNTPVYELERSNYTHLDAIYTIAHGKENSIAVPGNVESLTSVMANCIQHHWNADLIGRLTGSIKDMTENVVVKHLEFVPDRSAVDFIRNDAREEG